MKRIWFAIAFIILIASFCIYEQSYVKNCSDELISMIDEAQEFESAKNSEKRDEKIEEIQRCWERKNNFLFAFSDHGALDELAKNIRSLKEAHNMKSALAETKTLVIVYYENEIITLANIF